MAIRENDQPRVHFRSRAKAVGTNAATTATIAALTHANFPAVPSFQGEALVWSPTKIEVSGDTAALVTIESPSGTAIYSKRFTAAFQLTDTFDVGELVGAAAGAILVKISASTANCEVAIQAAAIPDPAGKSISAPALLATSI